MTDPDPQPQPQPIIPPEQLAHTRRTPTGQPLCYAAHPGTGRRCDLTMYHPGDHHISTANGIGADVYWKSDMPHGPNPDPNPPPYRPSPVPEPEPQPTNP